MKTIYLDIETIPQSAEALETMMPEEIRSPVMPTELENPPEPDWQAKCPKYGGDAEKRDAWIADAVKKWTAKTNADRDKWHATALENRARYVENAALRAESAHVKMIGLSVNGERTIYLWEPDRKMADAAAKEADAQKVALFLMFPLEAMMFQRFAKDFVAIMMADYENPNAECEQPPKRLPKGVTWSPDMHPPRVVTYYGNTFDLPLIARRSAICGEPALMRFLRMHKRGRYLDSTRFVDLHEEWTLGDRETKTGGLEGLCKILGVEGKSSPCGGSFYKFYAENPSEGVVYLLRDLAATEVCARKLGIE
jgi:hypothetical protein